jgi:1-acyl-sn-glycerol-3-phosphate acyltransferase
MRKFFTSIYFVYSIIVLLVTFVILCPFAIALLFFKNGGVYLYKIGKIWGHCFSFLIGIRWKRVGNLLPDKNEDYIFVSNHISYYDIFGMLIALNQPYRTLGKAEPAKYPVFGALYKKSVILVNRSSDEDRKKSVANLKQQIKSGLSVCIFPEGTFNNTANSLKDFYEGAFRIAIETQTPIMPFVMYDVGKRFHWKNMLGATPGISRYQFLESTPAAAFEGLTPSDLKQKIYLQMEAALLADNNNR